MFICVCMFLCMLLKIIVVYKYTSFHSEKKLLRENREFTETLENIGEFVYVSINTFACIYLYLFIKYAKVFILQTI